MRESYSTNQQHRNGGHGGSSSLALPSSSLRHLRVWVDWIQRQPVPKFLLSSRTTTVAVPKRLRRHHNNTAATSNDKNVTSSNSNNGISRALQEEELGTLGGDGGSSSDTIIQPPQPMFRKNNDEKDDDCCNEDYDEELFWIAGLDRVVFGTAAAADAVIIMGRQPPRYLWYMISGALCDVFQFGVNWCLRQWWNNNNTTSTTAMVMGAMIRGSSSSTTTTSSSAQCWFLSFVISIAARHTSHRYLVFGAYNPSYWPSLGRMYAGYSFSIVLSTLFNYWITQEGGVSHYVAYAITLLWTGVVNYFVLQRLWKMGGGGGPKGQREGRVTV